MTEIKEVKRTALERLKDEAKQEMIEEGSAKWKRQLKDKMKQLAQAKTIVRNIEREMEDLEISISEELG